MEKKGRQPCGCAVAASTMVVSTSLFQMATPHLLGPQELKGLYLRGLNFLPGPLERVSRGF